jgi:hypothetical protein
LGINAYGCKGKGAGFSTFLNSSPQLAFLLGFEVMQRSKKYHKKQKAKAKGFHRFGIWLMR